MSVEDNQKNATTPEESNVIGIISNTHWQILSMGCINTTKKFKIIALYCD